MTDTAQLKEVVIQIHGEPRTVFYLIQGMEVYIAGLGWAAENFFAFDVVDEICRQEALEREQYAFHSIWDYGSDPRTRKYGVYAVDRLEYSEDKDEDGEPVWVGFSTVAGREVSTREELPPLPSNLESVFRDFLTLP